MWPPTLSCLEMFRSCRGGPLPDREPPEHPCSGRKQTRRFFLHEAVFKESDDFRIDALDCSEKCGDETFDQIAEGRVLIMRFDDLFEILHMSFPAFCEGPQKSIVDGGQALDQGSQRVT